MKLLWFIWQHYVHHPFRPVLEIKFSLKSSEQYKAIGEFSIWLRKCEKRRYEKSSFENKKLFQKFPFGYEGHLITNNI